MKNNNKVRTTFGKYLEFDNDIELRKFIFDHSELFESYSEESIKAIKDLDKASLMRLGVRMINNKMVLVNISVDNFEKIKGMFVKTKMEHNRSKYVFNKGIG